MSNQTEDWTVFVNGLSAGEPGGITVDVGELAIRPTHTTRDGFPMEVLYEPDLGWLAMVDTSPKGGAK